MHYEDEFFYMIQMEKARNKNMVDYLNPSCTNVLDNITMEWYNKFDPGFMCIGKKTHHFGNDFYKIFCGIA